jgi:hypothetical protein
MDQFDMMMAWEAGELSDEDTVVLFQQLIDSGMAWQLQGCYGRMANAFIQAEVCHVKGA